MKKLSEFSDDQLALEGIKARIEDTEGKEIELLKCRFSASRFQGRCPEYVTLQFRLKGEDQLRVIFTGSIVIIDQLRKYIDQLPFTCMIVKINRYYALK
jgi:hypothetical protein